LQDSFKDYGPLFFGFTSFDIQSSFIRLIMSHNGEGILVKHYNFNPLSKLWKNIYYFVILNKNFNKYMKLAKIVMVQVLTFVEDQRTFDNISFLKNKLWNQFATNFHLCFKLFSKKIIQFPYDDATTLWKELII